MNVIKLKDGFIVINKGGNYYAGQTANAIKPLSTKKLLETYVHIEMTKNEIRQLIENFLENGNNN
jgi:hypothetical protein